MPTQLLYRIGLGFLKGIGPVAAKKLIARLGDAESVFAIHEHQLKNIPGIGQNLAHDIVSLRAAALKRAEQEMSFIEKQQLTPLFFADKNYPFRLKECNDAPVMLYKKGDSDLNTGKFLAVVGTRKITPYGKDLCRHLVAELLSRHSDITIISGLAFGVDICAHKSAIEAAAPTVGVLAHSLDYVYPAAHADIAARMLNGGAIVSEYPSGVFPDAHNFVQRNRIIAGLADAVVIVESAQKGGALITAEYANTYNRDVFAFPGRIDDTHSQGCNKLIAENKAALIQTASDLEAFMNWDTKNTKLHAQQSIEFDSLDECEKAVCLFLLNNKDAHINTICAAIDMPIQKTSSLLVKMEFNGLISCAPGNLYRLTF